MDDTRQRCALRSALSVAIVMSVALWVATARAASWNKLKTCEQSGFCRRVRRMSAQNDRACNVLKGSIRIGPEKPDTILSDLSCAVPSDMCIEGSDARESLLLEIKPLSGGIFRVTVDEKPGVARFARYRVENVIRDRMVKGRALDLSNDVSLRENGFVLRGDGDEYELEVIFDPFEIVLRGKSSEQVISRVNHDGLFRFERQEVEPAKPEEEANHAESPEGEVESAAADGVEQSIEQSASPTPPAPTCECDGCFAESFDGHSDEKKRGPEAIGLDVSFPGAKYTFGIPERASSFILANTKNNALGGAGEDLTEPYRLYNLDVFEYELDKPFGLYGSVPFLIAASVSHASGMLWLNAAETYVDLLTGSSNSNQVSARTHWFSESGVIDVFLLPGGPHVRDVLSQYTALTGAPVMPNRFALGYHQCRWNYRDDADTRAVDGGFDEHDIPYDVIWLDIEHTDGKRYFTWDSSRFPDPAALQRDVAARGRKMVTIVDPHIKRDDKYSVHKEATQNQYYVKKEDGMTDFDGWCWPGSSSYYDFTKASATQAWAQRFATGYPHFGEHLYTWVDMNEPSVFNGPEQTMSKTLRHSGGWEHRDLHNIYGMLVHRATFDGHLVARKSGDRPFVLSRAFFAGSQRYGAVWTGDNAAEWGHLRASVPMLLALQMTAIVFSGADVGGFFGNPSPELLVRWYQAAAFQPFFRGHAHLDTDRREPWLFGDDVTRQISTAIRERYSYLPLWYTLFAASAACSEHDGSQSGSLPPPPERDCVPIRFADANRAAPPMRPLLWQFSGVEDDALWRAEHAWMVGDALLVAPVLHEGVTKHHVKLPTAERSSGAGQGSTRWFDVGAGGSGGGELEAGVELEFAAESRERLFVFQRGGTVVPRQERRRRSSRAMALDPYSLSVAMDDAGSARGELYGDDGSSFAYANDEYALREFSLSHDGVLSARTVSGSGSGFAGASDAWIEKITIFGLRQVPSTVSARDPLRASNEPTPLPFTYDESKKVLTIKISRKHVTLPAFAADWSVAITYAAS
mmetsp:Transcript_3981/g.8750  ORF Transcript_3981/g.8750 Transcript_3981/m.8750 type:complete len:1031 (-) Transcript_3981:42-3134(-)